MYIALVLLQVLHFLCVVLTYLRVYTQLSAIESIFVDCVITFKTMENLKIHLRPPGAQYSAWVMAIFLGYPFVLMSLGYWRLFYSDANANEHCFHIFVITWPIFIASIVPRWFYILMLGGFYVLRTVNDELRKVAADAVDLDDTFNRLDAIGHVHRLVTQLGQRISDLVMTNVLVWLLNKAATLSVTGFGCLMYCSGWAYLEGFRMPIEILFSGIVGICVGVVEIGFFMHMCWVTVNEVIMCYVILIFMYKYY